MSTWPSCPQCKRQLKPVSYPMNSYLNRDQWESQRAGAWYCDTCPPNDRAETNPWCYWWDKEVIWSPEFCKRCDKPIIYRNYHQEFECLQNVTKQRDDLRTEVARLKESIYRINLAGY